MQRMQMVQQVQQVRSAVQLPLDPDMEEALVLKKARELYANSRLLSSRYATFERAMENPVQGKCLRLCATQLLRRGKGTRG